MNMPDFSRFSAPIMDAIRQQAAVMPDTPAFGPGREQQERWQALLKAQLENHQAQSRYQALLGKVMEQAFVVFEGKLAEHEAPGRHLGSEIGRASCRERGGPYVSISGVAVSVKTKNKI